MTGFTVAACQMDTQTDKAANVETALDYVDEAAARGADLVSFPEAFTFMGPKEGALEAAEPIPGPVTDRLSERAAANGIHVHAGSMHEAVEGEDRVRNTTVVFDDDGEMVATYSKIHMFDVSVEGEIDAQESALVQPGSEVVTAETDLGTLGLSVCYDLRFPGLYAELADRGATMLFVPSAFRAFTGKDHWEPLLKARAIENHAYVVAAGQTGTKEGSGPRHGRSLIIDPWGTVIGQASDREQLVFADVDTDYLEDVRRSLPVFDHRRYDLY